MLVIAVSSSRRASSCMQVLGHSKTCFVLLGSWLFLGETITLRQLGGMLLAIAGMVGYGVANHKCDPDTTNPEGHRSIPCVFVGTPCVRIVLRARWLLARSARVFHEQSSLEAAVVFRSCEAEI